jgi:DNA-binding transcriptional LysR family regulator
MELRHLRYFLALADELSFTRAAARVGIAQPPFSKQVQQLEEEIGAQLVVRSPRMVRLTEAGVEFAARARQLEDQLKHAVEATRRTAVGLVGRLRVGFTESGFFNPALSRCFLEYRRRYPEVELTLEEQKSTTLIEMLRRNELDAAFVRPPYPVDGRVVSIPLLREELIIAAPQDHSLARRHSATVAELRDETFVFYHRRVRPGLTDMVISACKAAGFEPKSGQEAPQLTSTLKLVSAGAGIAVVPASLANFRLDGVAFLRIEDGDLFAEIGLAVGSENQARTVGNFVELATGICRPD